MGQSWTRRYLPHALCTVSDLGYLFGSLTKSLNQKSREKRSCQRTEAGWRRAEGPSEIIKGISPQLNSPEEFNGARGVNMVQRTEGREQRVHCLLLP